MPAIYPKYKEALHSGLDVGSATVKAVFIDTDTYTYNAAHEFFSDLAGVGPVSNALTSKTFVNGVFDADNAEFPNAAGSESEAIVLFIDTGNPATDRLICFLDGITAAFNGTTAYANWNVAGIYAL